MSNENNQQVEYRKLGKTGLRVSVPIVGAMSFGNPAWNDWVLDEEKSLEVLKAAWDRGLNTIDTANVYSSGDSERVVGKFIKKYNIPREKIIIMSKCFFIATGDASIKTVGPGTEGINDQQEWVNQSGLSRAAIFNAVDASLARLDTPYIDLLQIHRYDPEVTAEETMKALHDLVQMNKVRYIGASSMRTWQFAHLNAVAEKNGWTKFVSMQNQYSLLYREEEREMIPYCKFNGIGLIPWYPLHSGYLARPLDADTTTRAESGKKGPFAIKLSDWEKEIINRVEEVAKKKDWKMAQVALTWAGSKVTSPIVGLSSAQRVNESVVRGFELAEEEIKYLEEPYQPKKVSGHQ
jgi:aryl-alcohol dehydrogenase-like predicted oxidoreductase